MSSDSAGDSKKRSKVGAVLSRHRAAIPAFTWKPAKPSAAARASVAADEAVLSQPAKPGGYDVVGDDVLRSGSSAAYDVLTDAEVQSNPLRSTVGGYDLLDDDVLRAGSSSGYDMLDDKPTTGSHPPAPVAASPNASSSVEISPAAAVPNASGPANPYVTVSPTADEPERDAAIISSPAQPIEEAAAEPSRKELDNPWEELSRIEEERNLIKERCQEIINNLNELSSVRWADQKSLRTLTTRALEIQSTGGPDLLEFLNRDYGEFLRIAKDDLDNRIVDALDDPRAFAVPAATRDEWLDRSNTIVSSDHSHASIKAASQLLKTIDSETERCYREVGKVMVTLESLMPLVPRALQLYVDHGMIAAKEDLSDRSKNVANGFPQYGGNAELPDLQKEVAEIQKLISQAMAMRDPAKELKAQRESLSCDPSELKVAGALGEGMFGQALKLSSPTGELLVGKRLKTQDEIYAEQGIPKTAERKERFQAMSDMAKIAFANEEQIYARLGEHPNLAKCYGLQDVNGEQMLVMKQVEGTGVDKVFGNLEAKLRSGKISQAEYVAGIQHILKGTLQALAHCEAMGVAHLDVKGDNIMLDAKTKQPILMDMGSAHLVDSKMNGNFIPENLPPESTVSKATASTKHDSFSVGKMLFPMMEKLGGVVATFQFLPGLDAKQAIPHSGTFLTGHLEASKHALGKTIRPAPDGKIERKVEGVSPAPTLKPRPEGTPKLQIPGQYGVASTYVDFMNRITSTLPEDRMTPSEALAHPFIMEALSSSVDLDKVFS